MYSPNLNLSLLRSHSFLFPTPLFHSKPKTKTLTLTLTLTIRCDALSTYGPSLYKGTKPSLPRPPPQLTVDRDAFTRIFDIAALRVPADQCFSLESRLRGHLLNWPRVRNIARVPGDDIEPQFKFLLPLPHSTDDDDKNTTVVDSINRRIPGISNEPPQRLSPVLYREKLVKSFNCRGFLKFRNLAKISRPKKTKKKKDEEKGGEGEKRAGKNDIMAVEVVVDKEEEEDSEEDMSGLLGEGFKGGRWRGPTRLLLLDERFANCGFDELPEAVKVDLL